MSPEMCGGLGICRGFPAVGVTNSQRLLSPERAPSDLAAATTGHAREGREKVGQDSERQLSGVQGNSRTGAQGARWSLRREMCVADEVSLG